MFELLGCIASLSLPLLGGGQVAEEGGENLAIRLETVELRWDEGQSCWARLRLPGGEGTLGRAFRGEGGEQVELWPPHETWTICFLNHGSDVTIDALSRLCPELKRVGAPGIEILESREMSDEGLRLISDVTSLERVILGDTDSLWREEPSEMTVLGVRQLAALPNLKHLYLEDFAHFTDEDLAATVDAFPRLESIGFASCAVDRKTIQAIASLDSLQSLSLRKCWTLVDDDLEALGSRASLRSLSLFECRRLTGRFVRYLATLEQLAWLDLGWCGSMEGRVLERLGQFKELAYLDIRRMRGITEEGLRTLADLPNLKTLSVISCREIS